MVQKPPVNIEWYDDGFSMEEQAQLAYEYRKAKRETRPVIKVTEEYHEKTKDRIIAELRQKLAANEEYIKELEESSGISEQMKQLQEELRVEKERSDNYKRNYTELNKKYQLLLENPELGTQKYRDTIKKLEEEIKHLHEVRNELIQKLLATNV